MFRSNNSYPLDPNNLAGVWGVVSIHYATCFKGPSPPFGRSLRSPSALIAPNVRISLDALYLLRVPPHSLGRTMTCLEFPSAGKNPHMFPPTNPRSRTDRAQLTRVPLTLLFAWNLTHWLRVVSRVRGMCVAQQDISRQARRLVSFLPSNSEQVET